MDSSLATCFALALFALSHGCGHASESMPHRDIERSDNLQESPAQGAQPDDGHAPDTAEDHRSSPFPTARFVALRGSISGRLANGIGGVRYEDGEEDGFQVEGRYGLLRNLDVAARGSYQIEGLSLKQDGSSLGEHSVTTFNAQVGLDRLVDLFASDLRLWLLGGFGLGAVSAPRLTQESHGDNVVAFPVTYPYIKLGFVKRLGGAAASMVASVGQGSASGYYISDQVADLVLQSPAAFDAVALSGGIGYERRYYRNADQWTKSETSALRLTLGIAIPGSQSP